MKALVQAFFWQFFRQRRAVEFPKNWVFENSLSFEPKSSRVFDKYTWVLSSKEQISFENVQNSVIFGHFLGIFNTETAKYLSSLSELLEFWRTFAWVLVIFSLSFEKIEFWRPWVLKKLPKIKPDVLVLFYLIF